MYKISKEFDFDFGHRVYTQQLDERMSLTSNCKCRHLHGHTGKIIVELSADELTNGMVTDFTHLNFFKKFIDDYFDHKFIAGIDDPMLPILGRSFLTEDFFVYESLWNLHDYRISEEVCVWFKSLNRSGLNSYCQIFHLDSSAFEEVAESFVVVNFVPTSENLSHFFYVVLVHSLNQLGLSDKLKVTKVTFKETSKTCSIYEG